MNELPMDQAARLSGKTVKAINLMVDEGKLLAWLDEKGQRFTTVAALQMVRLLAMGSLSDYPPTIKHYPRPVVPTKRREEDEPQNAQRRRVNPKQTRFRSRWVSE